MRPDQARGHFVAPLLMAVVALGLALSFVQQCTIPDEVFYSGDGGMKALVAKQFARGDWHADLRLPAEPWVEALWRDGLYPFGPPFAYADGERWLVQYPVPFMALTAPFYRWFGFRGLTIVPLLGLWLAWLSTALLLSRVSRSPQAVAVGVGGLVFASFATPYGAMYWEHTLALGLSCAGLALLLPATPAGRGPARHLSAGLLLGAAVWARPESLWFAVGVCAALPLLGRAARPWLAACAGVAAAGLLFAVFNLWLYGQPLGVHAVQQVDEATLHVPHLPAHEVAWFFVYQLVRLCPIAGGVALGALIGFRVTALRVDRTQAALWVVIAVSCLGTALVVPNAGGDQIGARYFLHALPPLFALLALQWDAVAGLTPGLRKVVRSAVLVVLAVGVYQNAVRGTEELHDMYREQMLPALEALRADPTTVIAVEHQWIAQGLEAAFEDKIFFRVRDAAGLDRLSRAMLDRHPSRFTLLRLEGAGQYVREGEDFRLLLTTRGRHGFVVFMDAVVMPR